MRISDWSSDVCSSDLMNVAFDQETFAVDTHIFRISNRTGLAPGKTPLAVEKTLDRVVPQPFRLHAHHWLILHGRYVWKARKPECWRCVVADLCAYKPKTPPQPACNRWRPPGCFDRRLPRPAPVRSDARRVGKECCNTSR